MAIVVVVGGDRGDDGGDGGWDGGDGGVDCEDHGWGMDYDGESWGASDTMIGPPTV